MAGKMDYYKAELEKFLNKKNVFTDYLNIIEKKTNIKKMYIFLGGLGFLMLYLWIGYGAGLLCNLIGFVYPAYMSIKAVESPNKEDDLQWLTYWVVYAVFGTIEFFSDILLSWFPFYWLAKCLFLVWCAAPISANGSDIMYSRVIRPVFLRNERKIDQVAHTAKQYVDMTTEKAREIVTEAALKSD